MKFSYIIFNRGFFTLASDLYAQERETDFNIRAGFSIGVASPIGFPEPIRKIQTFNPGLQLSVEAGMTYHITKQWGIGSAFSAAIKRPGFHISPVPNNRV